MAYVFTKNSLPTNGTIAVYALKTLLISAGWTVTRSGDGLSAYNAAGDVITHAGSGANGLRNPRAWFVLKQPGVVTTAQRQLCFQTDADITWNYVTYRLKYSWNSGFTVGTSNATTTPSATDQVVLLGGGTDTTPTYDYILPQSFGVSVRAQYIANNAAPYDFCMLSHTSGGSGIASVFMMDGMVSGSYDVLDVDPYVFYQAVNSATAFVDTSFSVYGSGNSVGPHAFYKKGLSGEAFLPVAGLLYTVSTNVKIPGGMGVNPYSSKDQVYPLLYGRDSGQVAPVGLKGQSTLLKWCSNARNTGDTLSVLGTKDYYCANASSPYCVALPWDGTTPSV